MKTSAPTPARLLKVISLAAVIFLTVSGGPYGLEPLLKFAGKDGALLLLLLVPLLCDIPTLLMVLELNSMMPVNGGYYKWVDRALGKRWAFFEGWWTWLYSFTDLAIYPVLFSTYISFLFPALVAWKTVICLVMIWGCAGLNILGIVPVGRTSLILGAIIIIPFLLVISMSFINPTFHYTMPTFSFKGIEFSSFGMALYTVMWNFLGWDNTTTYADEVDKPIKTYLKSSIIAFLVVMFLYLFTIYITQNSGVNFDELNDKYFPLLGQIIGGQWLAILLSIGGMASALGIFMAVMLSISRIPKAMAKDKLLPEWFAKTNKQFNAPYVSIIICAVVTSFMCLWSFTELIVIDVILYSTGLFLEFNSLIVLRIKEPNAERPFKVPLSPFFLSLLILLPTIVYGTALASVIISPDTSKTLIYFAVGALLTAPVAWQFVKRIK